MKPGTLEIQPPILVATLGGAVGVLLLLSLLHLAPAAGFELLDYPRLIGGIVSSNPDTALGLGAAVIFLFGWLLWPPLLAITWSALPGDPIHFTGAALKGLVGGFALWLVAGLLLPLFGALNRVEVVAEPGWFGLAAGAGSAAAFLLGHLGYGLAVALIGAMGRGISPIESLGVEGYRTMGGLVAHPRTGIPKQ
jgi:hypothetical protein